MATKKSGKAAAMGRPSKYTELVKPKLMLVEAWARDGLTNEQIASNLGIHVDSLYEYQKKHTEFSDALKRGKEVVDVEVENALYKKTQGYTVQLKKTFKVKEKYVDNDGNKLERERLETGIDEVHIPADTTAQIFWLKNRKPDCWRDKKETELSGNVNNPLDGISTAELRKLLDK